MTNGIHTVLNWFLNWNMRISGCGTHDIPVTILAEVEFSKCAIFWCLTYMVLIYNQKDKYSSKIWSNTNEKYVRKYKMFSTGWETICQNIKMGTKITKLSHSRHVLLRLILDKINLFGRVVSVWELSYKPRLKVQ